MTDKSSMIDSELERKSANAAKHEGGSLAQLARSLPDIRAGAR